MIFYFNKVTDTFMLRTDIEGYRIVNPFHKEKETNNLLECLILSGRVKSSNEKKQIAYFTCVKGTLT